MTPSRKSEKRFSLIETFKKFDNPFTESQPDLISIVPKEVISEKAATSVRNVYSVGKWQCSDFIKERLCNSSEQRMSIYTKVKKNRLALFRSKSIVAVPKVKRETTALKERIKLYSSLYVGCKSRQANLDEFFHHENYEYSPLLSDYGSIRKPTSKADFLKCLPQFTDDSDKETFEKYEAPSVDGCIIDGVVLVQINNPRTSRTFGEYCGIEISERAERIANTVERVDIVFDVYRKALRKLETREGREKNEGIRISIKKNTPVYRKFNQVLEVSENKTTIQSRC